MEKNTTPKKEETRSKIYDKYYPYPIPFDPEVGMDVFTPTDKAPPVEDVSKEFKKANCYMSNAKLMKAGIEFPYTEEQLKELTRCSKDIIYFIVNYCKVITLNGGIDFFKLYQYQKNAIKVIHENRFSIFKFPRQMGKCSTKDTNIQIRINGTELDLTISDLYNLIEVENLVESYTPNNDYEILTQDGFKNFDGITTRYVDSILEINLSNNTSIRVTHEHDVMLYNNTFIKAKDLTVGDELGVNESNKVVSITELNGNFKVADMIEVKDTHSFAANDMSAILSNCIDGDSIITLLDNHTGEIFDIPISELYDYLTLGAKSD